MTEIFFVKTVFPPFECFSQRTGRVPRKPVRHAPFAYWSTMR